MFYTTPTRRREIEKLESGFQFFGLQESFFGSNAVQWRKGLRTICRMPFGPLLNHDRWTVGDPPHSYFGTMLFAPAIDIEGSDRSTVEGTIEMSSAKGF